MTTSDLPTVSETSQIQPSATLTFRPLPPLIPGEEVSNYDTLLARVSGAVKRTVSLRRTAKKDTGMRMP